MFAELDVLFFMNFLGPFSDSKELHPRYFYKYIPFTKSSFIKDIIYKNTLYFSLPREFHGTDAYDCRAYKIEIKTKQDRLLCIKDGIKTSYPNLPREQRRKMIKQYMQKYGNPEDRFYTKRIERLNSLLTNGFNKERTCIFCVTDSSENIEMWKEYIPNGEGVCIKLDNNIIEEHLNSSPISASNFSPHLFFLRPIDYIDKILQISFRDFVEREPGSVGRTLLYTKFKKFAFEQEYRYIIHECINQRIQFPSEIIKEVTTGPNTSYEQMELLNLWNSSRQSPFIINKKGT